MPTVWRIGFVEVRGKLFGRIVGEGGPKSGAGTEADALVRQLVGDIGAVLFKGPGWPDNAMRAAIHRV